MTDTLKPCSECGAVWKQVTPAHSKVRHKADCSRSYRNLITPSLMDKDKLGDRRIAELTRGGETLAAQLGGIFVVDRRRVRDFRARAAQGIETRSATDAKRRGPKGESAGPQDIAQGPSQ